MNPQLEAFKDARDKRTGEGRDELESRKMADVYVQQHPEKFENLKELSTFVPTEQFPTCPSCRIDSGEHVCTIVKTLEVFRSAGFEDQYWECEIWLLHHFEPQQIGGPMRVQIRRPGGGSG